MNTPSTSTTSSSGPVTAQYKGHPMIVLNPDDRFPFQFGLNKARLVLEHIEAIRAFVAATEAAPARQQAA